MKISVLAALILISFQSSNAREFDYPGGVTELFIPKTSSSLPIIRYGLKEPAILDQGTQWRVLIGIDLNQLPGDYIVYTRQDEKGETAVFTKFQVMHKSYSLMRGTDTPPTELPDYKSLSELDFTNTQPPSVPMQLPFSANWSENFGQQTIVKQGNATKTQNHTFSSAPAHTLIKAPQRGIVCKIITLKNGANTVIIDHGRGIYSLLHNIADLAVDLGNGVVAGAVIGKVPTLELNDKPSNAKNQTLTEASTHVYWQVQLNGVFVNPLIMTQL